MAARSSKASEYITRAEQMCWDDLAQLWQQIKAGTADWDPGKALEHLVIRAFRLSNMNAEYPYDVPPGGKPIEQIDGIVYTDANVFLIECKDEDSIDVEAIAKIRNQLLRRPPTTMGCVFVAGQFTGPALMLTDFAVPHRILLWPEADIENALGKKDFQAVLREKHLHLCMYGLTDHSPSYKDLEVE